MSENKEPGDLDEHDDADVSSAPTPTSTTTSGARGRSRRGPGRPTHPHMHQTGTDLEPKDAAWHRSRVCGRYYEELGEGPCRTCHEDRGWHTHQPVVQQGYPDVGIGPNMGVSAAAASARAAAKELRDRERDLISMLQKTLTPQPNWKEVEGETATQFIERLKRELLSCGCVVPVDQWYRGFPLIVDQHNIEVREWVNNNIVVKKLAWDDASLAFIRRYTPVDEKERLTAKYRDCHHKEGQTCREYGQEFQQLAQLLEIPLDTVPTVTQYRLGLRGQTQARVLDEINRRRYDNPEFAVTKLADAMHLAELLDTSSAASSSSVGNRDNTAVSGESTTSVKESHRVKETQSDRSHQRTSDTQQERLTEGKYCSHHKTTTHNTEECDFLRARRQQQQQGGAGTSVSSTATAAGPPLAPSRPASQTGAVSRWKIRGDCYKCGEPGHRAADCIVGSSSSSSNSNGRSGGVTPGGPSQADSATSHRSAKRVKCLHCHHEQ